MQWTIGHDKPLLDRPFSTTYEEIGSKGLIVARNCWCCKPKVAPAPPPSTVMISSTPCLTGNIIGCNIMSLQPNFIGKHIDRTDPTRGEVTSCCEVWVNRQWWVNSVRARPEKKRLATRKLNQDHYHFW